MAKRKSTKHTTKTKDRVNTKLTKKRGRKGIFFLIFKMTDIIILNKGQLPKYVGIHTCP